MGVASKLIEPLPPYFAGFLKYSKRKFVERLKLIGSLLWEMEIINFSITAMILYTVQFGIHEKKARGCSKVMVNFTKNLFYKH